MCKDRGSVSKVYLVEMDSSMQVLAVPTGALLMYAVSFPASHCLLTDFRSRKRMHTTSCQFLICGGSATFTGNAVLICARRTNSPYRSSCDCTASRSEVRWGCKRRSRWWRPRVMVPVDRLGWSRAPPPENASSRSKRLAKIGYASCDTAALETHPLCRCPDSSAPEQRLGVTTSNELNSTAREGQGVLGW